MWEHVVRTLTLAVALAIVGGCVSASEKGPEKPRVAVLEIEGKKSSKIRSAVIDLLEERYDIVTEKRYNRVAKRLRARKLKSSHVAKVADELNLAAVVHGELNRKRRGRYELELAVLESNGEVIDTISVELKSRKKLKGKRRRKLERSVYGTLDDVIETFERKRKREERKKAKREKEERKKAKRERKRREEREKRRKRRRSADDDDDDDDDRRSRRSRRDRDADDDDDDDDDRRKSRRSRRDRDADDDDDDDDRRSRRSRRDRDADDDDDDDDRRKSRRSRRDRDADDDDDDDRRSKRSRRDKDDDDDDDRKRKKKKRKKKDIDDIEDVVFETDDSGQALDDDMPDMFQ